MPYGFPAAMLGMIVSGDIGPSTIYTDRFGHVVEFPKSPPKEPPSIGQTHQRNRFKAAQANYMALSPQTRAQWEDLARAASLCMTGQNLFIHISLRGAYALLTTLNHQHGFALDDPDAV